MRDFESRAALVAEQHAKELDQLRASLDAENKRKSQLLEMEKQRLDEQVPIVSTAALSDRRCSTRAMWRSWRPPATRLQNSTLPR